MKYFILLFTLLFHTLVYSQLNTSNRTVNQKLNFKAGANFNSLTASTILTLDGSKDLASSSVTTADLAFIDNLLSLDTNGDGIVQFVDSTDSFTASKVISGTEGIVLPSGTTAQRDGTPTAGEIRYNTDTNTFEGYSNAWGAIGGGGGGGLDIFYNQDHETDVDSSDYTTGLNATFDNIGTLGGALADETTNPIAGATSIKYTTSATATNSTNDWIASASITLDDKQKGNFVGFNFFYTWDGSDDLLCVIVWDDTNDEVLNDSTDCLETASNPTRYSLGVFIPTSTNAIKLGFHHTGASESSKVLVFDDLELSSNPFVYKNLASENVYSARIANNGTATVTSQNQSWIDSVSRAAAGLVVVDYSSLGLTVAPSITATPEISNVAQFTAHIDAISTTSATIRIGFDNGTDLDTDFSITLKKQGADYKAPAEHVVTPAKSNLTDWESYTPTTQGFGTISSDNVFYKRVGDSLIVQGEFTTGTVAASEAQIGLPSGLTIDSAKVPTLRLVGRFATASTSSSVVKNFGVLATGGDTFFNISQANYHSTQSPLSPQNGNSEISSSQKVSFFAEVPIAEWSSDATFLAAVPMNYSQTKYLSSNQGSDGLVSDLEFNNLVVGKRYRIYVRAIVDGGDNDTVSLRVLHDGSAITDTNNSNAGNGNNQATINFEFTATNTSLTFDLDSLGSGALEGNGTAVGGTFATLTELNYTKETTRFE